MLHRFILLEDFLIAIYEIVLFVPFIFKTRSITTSPGIPIEERLPFSLSISKFESFTISAFSIIGFAKLFFCTEATVNFVIEASVPSVKYIFTNPLLLLVQNSGLYKSLNTGWANKVTLCILFLEKVRISGCQESIILTPSE